MIDLIIRQLGTVDYLTTWQAMKDFTDQRDENTVDELWLLQHPPVFTQGQAGKAEHLLNPHDIPVIQSDRGGQITYHGPGQLMMYALCDLRRLKLSPRQLVSRLENTLIDFLKAHHCEATARPDAPGVYADQKKLASIGLRVRKGCSYHGIALNVAMDLTPFSYINPCGFSGLKMTQVQELLPELNYEAVINEIIPCFMQNFGYNQPQFERANL
ncbi:MAG TPA: lipoyl(octanoyl) transferase LipB [Coxiellaceae bacterium]|nr:lipoyl(octanoyl) transferase LipB [Coxiellaceae bacterium]